MQAIIFETLPLSLERHVSKVMKHHNI